MDFGSLMWDETGRDLDHEKRELSRTAALADAERTVGQFLYLAADQADLGHRLALAEDKLQAIASARGYGVEQLTGDLTERWQLLSQARTAAARKTAARRQVTATAEMAMDAVAARLAVVAARQNPAVPMAECLKLAAEAVAKHANAYPLAYESWGGTGDGPITERAKNFTPKSDPPKPYDPSSAPDPDPGMFDSVHKRLDDLETKLGETTASLEPTVAGFFQRLKDWWHGSPEQAPAHTPAPAPAPAAEERAPYMIPTNNAASDHVDDVVQRHHDEQGRREFNEIMRRLDSDQAEMRHKFDTSSRDRFEHPEQVSHYLQGENDRRAADMEGRLDSLGDSVKPTPPSTPAGGFSHGPRHQVTDAPLDHPEPATFSHAEHGHGGGQQMLPTDPAEHAFSHRASLDYSLFD
jgi:tetrahydromethanopterin S-methyltransferase subunit G